MPLPIGLVVKNGSKARVATSGGIPVPVSVTDSSTYCPGGTSLVPRTRLIQPPVRRLDPQNTPIRHRVARIDAEVQQRIFKLAGVHQRGPEIIALHGLDRDVRADRPLDQLVQSRHQPVHVRPLRIERLPAGKREQPVRQRRRPRGCTLRGLDIPLRLANAPLRHAALQQLQAATDANQQIVEIMRQATGQLADRLHLLRLAQLFLPTHAAASCRWRFPSAGPAPCRRSRYGRGTEPTGSSHPDDRCGIPSSRSPLRTSPPAMTTPNRGRSSG